jgi:hypothetical protein
MSKNKRAPQGKTLNKDTLIEVKPLKPWPDPPPKKEPAPQPTQKPSEEDSGSKQNPKQPAKKD